MSGRESIGTWEKVQMRSVVRQGRLLWVGDGWGCDHWLLSTVNMGDLYFEGDPATDSPRRHMERVLKGEGQSRKWPWFLMALGGGGLWAIWRTAAQGGRSREAARTTGTAKKM